MNVTVGIDLVDIERFAHFYHYSHKRLLRIFSPDEIDHCLKIPVKSAERFAARFAYKEALFKALSHQNAHPPCPLFKLLKNTSLTKDLVPHAQINWEALETAPKRVALSFTHTKNSACAVVILSDL